MKTRIALLVLLAVALGLSAAASIAALVPALPAAARALSAFALAVAGALVLHLVGHLVRSEKHAALLREIRPIGRAQVFRGQMIGFMFNALLPARLGELVRAHYVGRSVQISRSAVLATIAFERLVDLVIVGVVGVIGVALLGDATASFWSLPIAALAAALVLSGVLWVAYAQPRFFLSAVYRVSGLLNDRLSTRVRQIVWSFSHALIYALPTRRVLLRYLALSVVMWAAYLGSIVLIAAVVLTGAMPGLLTAAAAAPFLGVTGWTGPAVFGDFAVRLGAVLGDAPHVPVLATLTWALLVVPSVVLGVACLLHRRLVEHTQGVPAAPVLRNKLFRDVYASEEFAHLLATHYQGNSIARIVSREESLGRFTVIRPLKGGSNASTLLVWQDGRVLVKKVTLPEFTSKLRSQYDWLHQRRSAPEIVDVVGSTQGRDHFAIDLEFRERYVSFFEHLHATTKDQAWSILTQTLDFMAARVYRGVPVEDGEARVRAYIDDKVLGKVRDCAAMVRGVSRLVGYDSLEINGERMRNLTGVVEEILASPEMLADLSEFTDGPIHGDMTIDNLMVDPSSGRFMLIDPNDENLISDPVVDYGKLMQSLHSGYEFLLDQERVRVVDDRVSFEERRSAHYEFLYSRSRQRFERDLTPARARSLLFHEAVHYCRMLTYRAAIDPGTAPMYYAVAVRLFNRFLAQYPAPASAGPSTTRMSASVSG